MSWRRERERESQSGCGGGEVIDKVTVSSSIGGRLGGRARVDFFEMTVVGVISSTDSSKKEQKGTRRGWGVGARGPKKTKHNWCSVLLATAGEAAVGVDESLELVVHDQDQSTTSATENVGASTLEQSHGTLVLHDLTKALQSASVQNVGATRLHHQTTAHSVEGVGDQARDGGDQLSDDKVLPERSFGSSGQQNTLGGIVSSKEGSAVDNNSNHRHSKALVQSTESILLEDLGHAIQQTVELTSSILANISSQTGTGKVQGVHKQQRGGTSSTTGCQVASKEFPEANLRGGADKDLLVGVLEGKVQGLGGEVTDDVGSVSAPQGQDTLLSRHTLEAVEDTLVLVLLGDLSGGGLHLHHERKEDKTRTGALLRTRTKTTNTHGSTETVRERERESMCVKERDRDRDRDKDRG